jgi:hypothetical protein
MKIFKLTVSLLLLTWCAGFFYFLHYTKNISNENRNMTEAIIVYGGNKQRLYIGAQLLKLGYAPIIFVTGDKPKEEYTNFIKSNNLIPEQFLFDYALANNNLNPINDALAFLKKYQFQTARVVVNSTQLPRARLEYTSKAPFDIALIFHAVSKKDERTFPIFVEYLKYCVILFTSFVGIEDELDLSYT